VGEHNPEVHIMLDDLEDTIAAIRDAGVGLTLPTSTPSGNGGKSSPTSTATRLGIYQHSSGS
jgi:hypothetical protein